MRSSTNPRGDDAPSAGEPDRRRFLKWALAAGGVAAGGLLVARGLFPGESAGDAGGPLFLSAEAADGFLRPADIVFGLATGGETRAYPQRILVWHEIVNDRVGDEVLAVTYCPLTGSQIGFRARTSGLRTTLPDERLDAFHGNRIGGGPAKDGIPAIDVAPRDRTFGTTGRLVNSNLLMYDRATDSEWPQILGTAITGTRRREVLEEVPLVWTTWDRWRRRHPETRVLGTRTGFVRDYHRDPYGFYDPEPQGYYSSSSVWFPTLYSSDRFHPKQVVFGLVLGGQPLALPFEDLRAARVRNFVHADVPLVALHDDGLDTVRVFRRTLEGQELTFARSGGEIVDEATGSVWSPEGVAREGPLQGRRLETVNAFNVMWFSWFAFHPETEVLGV